MGCAVRLLGRYLRSRIRNIFVNDKMDMTRLGLGCGSLLWSLQLAMPVVIFPTAEQIAQGKGRMTYSIMAYLPENVWALLFLVHGISVLYALLSNARNRYTLWMDAVLGMLLWTGSTLSCYIAHWPKGLPFTEAILVYASPAAMTGEAIMSVYAWWYMIRHWADDPRPSELKKIIDYGKHNKC